MNGFFSEKVGVEFDELAGDLGGLAEVGFPFLVFGGEDVGMTDGELAIAVAASSGLGDGIQAGEGAINHGEIDIDTRFDELGGNEAHGLSCDEAGADCG